MGHLEDFYHASYLSGWFWAAWIYTNKCSSLFFSCGFSFPLKNHNPIQKYFAWLFEQHSLWNMFNKTNMFREENISAYENIVAWKAAVCARVSGINKPDDDEGCDGDTKFQFGLIWFLHLCARGSRMRRLYTLPSANNNARSHSLSGKTLTLCVRACRVCFVLISQPAWASAELKFSSDSSPAAVCISRKT